MPQCLRASFALALPSAARDLSLTRVALQDEATATQLQGLVAILGEFEALGTAQHRKEEIGGHTWALPPLNRCHSRP